jgi:hypothetical protein
VPAADQVSVYSNLLDVRRYEAMMRSTLLRTGGHHIKRMPGAGPEFRVKKGTQLIASLRNRLTRRAG